MAGRLVSSIRKRIADREDPEHQQVAIRVGLVSVALLYFHSGYFAARAPSPEFVRYAAIAVTVSFVITMLLAVAVLAWPRVSVMRRIAGMLHDVAAISIAMYLGEAAAAAVAAIYLWVTLGNGFRYGNAYLYGCAALSFLGFGTVALTSEYWAANHTLTANILILLALIPPYVGGLLRSLQKAKAQLRRQASVDVVTGLKNRAETEMNVERALDREHEGHVLLFCDLDLFKQVNDSAGHAAGDKLLADVGRIISECSGDDAEVGRIGGDEFCVFLQHCTMEHARQVAERIRNCVSGYRLAWGRDYYSVGISVGVAPTSAVQDIGSLFRLADAACYAAKNAGRNQVHVVDPRTGVADTQRIRKLHAEATRVAGDSGRIRRMAD